MKQNKKRILLFTDWYFPGYKAGGPIQSCRNLVNSLRDEFSFYVFTSNTDLGEITPYPDLKPDQWLEKKTGEKIYYARKSNVTIALIRKIVQEVQPDAVYFNSMFSVKYTIIPRVLLKTIRFNGRIVLAPRGMLHQGALALKAPKKKLFLHMFRMLKLQKKICFHATDQQEVKDIKRLFPDNAITLAANIPNVDIAYKAGRQKKEGAVRLVFISRIHPTKNLTFILDTLRSYPPQGMVVLDVYGEAVSDKYMNECKEIVEQLKENIAVRFLGGIPNHEVVDKLPQYDALVLPTLGENFGHVIFEALMSGVPTLISDQTPWRALASVQAGWDIALHQPELFAEVIQELINMEQDKYIQWSSGARKKAEDYLANADFKNNYHDLFQ